MKHHKKQPRSMPVAAVIGWGISCLTALGLAVLFTLLVERGVLPMGSMTVCAMICIGVGGIVGCIFTAKQVDRGALPGTMLCGVMFFLTLCIFNGILEKGEFHRFIPTAVMVFASAVLCGLLGARKKKITYR